MDHSNHTNHEDMYHYEKSEFIPAKPEAVFMYADDHTNFSSHMNKSSWMMGGGKMETFSVQIYISTK